MSRRSLNMIELLLILCFTSMALYAVRFIPPFAIIVSPILGKHTELLLGQLQGRMADLVREKSNNIASFDASPKGFLWVVGAVLMVTLALISGRLEHNFDREKMPLSAVDFLKKIDLRGNMFNDFSFGGYLIYSAYPNYKVFIDGRTYTYGNERVKEYLTIDGLKPGWEEIIEKYHINWIIFNPDSALSRFLLERQEWRLIYADRVANIFLKDIPENKDLIDRYGDVKLVPTEIKGRKEE